MLQPRVTHQTFPGRGKWELSPRLKNLSWTRHCPSDKKVDALRSAWHSAPRAAKNAEK
jgi:hypothetical protein